jgi:hypothetical protein
MAKTPAQDFSSLVFGRTHHLAIVVHIAALDPDATFTQAQLEHALGVRNTSSIQRSVAALSQAGFIRKLPRGHGGREQPYERSGSQLWLFATELTRRAAAYEAAGGDPVGAEADEPIQPHLFST